MTTINLRGKIACLDMRIKRLSPEQERKRSILQSRKANLSEKLLEEERSAMLLPKIDERKRSFTEEFRPFYIPNSSRHEEGFIRNEELEKEMGLWLRKRFGVGKNIDILPTIQRVDLKGKRKLEF